MKDFLKKIKKSLKKIFFGLIISFLILAVLDSAIYSKVLKDSVYSYEEASIKSDIDYPVLKASFVPSISARSAIVMDSESGVVLYEKNPIIRLSSASTTKIMTALTALDHFKLTDILVVKKEATEGSVLGLKTGQRMTFEDLLYALLLPSTNDTALTIASNFNGGEVNFIKKMNENARNLNLFNTHFEDSAGLLDDGDYTTAKDLARLASIALQNETFAKIVSTKEKVIGDLGGKQYLLKNLNKLLGSDGVLGVKTGYTEGAGQVLVTAKEEKGHKIIIVVMGSEDRFLDTQKLINLVSGNISFLQIHP